MITSHHKWAGRVLCTLCLVLWCFGAGAQVLNPLDSIRFLSRYKWMDHAAHDAYRSMRRDAKDTVFKVDREASLNEKSEQEFEPYAGKIIRHIVVRQVGFESSLNDTSSRIVSFASRAADALQPTTRDWVIKDNLFIKEKSHLNPYKLADNERFLRSLSYIKDVRILVDPIPGDDDSVDVIVMSKDLFAVGVSGAASGLTQGNLSVSDDNFLGLGQRVEASTLYNQGRQPKFGYELGYVKRSIGGSFINATVGYTNIKSDLSGKQDEHSFLFSLDRPLVSPYSHFTGGVSYSHNRSDNLYHIADSQFNKYQYSTYDFWIGYNLGTKKMLDDKDNAHVRDRKFLSLRYFNNAFDQVPVQIGNKFDPLYNNKQGVLGQLTFFREDFYKTNFIYGFGVTEDLPYGYNLSITGGWYKQLYLARPYFGIDANRYLATDNGMFIQYFLRGGTFYANNQLQDASILVGASAYSQLFNCGDVKMRIHVNASYTELFNKVIYDPLRIDNVYGLRDFNSDSAFGNTRISLQTEMVLYLQYKLLGFQFAPFPYADISLLTPEHQSIDKSDLFMGLGGGIRTRNENLVFGTIELRFIYFPRVIANERGFKVTLTSQLRYRYRSTYIMEPGIAALNTDY